MNNFFKKIFLICIVLFGFSMSIFAKENITLYFDEISIEDKTTLFIYGSAEAEDFDSHKWQLIKVSIKDINSNEKNI